MNIKIKIENLASGLSFGQIADAVDRSLSKAPFPLDPRSVGRPKKGEFVEETETLTLRLPKGMVDKISEAAHRFGMSRNRFLKIGAMRMIEDPVRQPIERLDVACLGVGKASHGHPSDPIGAFRVLVLPRDIIPCTRRKHFDVVPLGESLGHQPAVVFRSPQDL